MDSGEGSFLFSSLLLPVCSALMLSRMLLLFVLNICACMVMLYVFWLYNELKDMGRDTIVAVYPGQRPMFKKIMMMGCGRCGMHESVLVYT